MQGGKLVRTLLPLQQKLNRQLSSRNPRETSAVQQDSKRNVSCLAGIQEKRQLSSKNPRKASAVYHELKIKSAVSSNRIARKTSAVRKIQKSALLQESKKIVIYLEGIQKNVSCSNKKNCWIPVHASFFWTVLLFRSIVIWIQPSMISRSGSDLPKYWIRILL